jgi:hypothetical protein
MIIQTVAEPTPSLELELRRLIPLLEQARDFTVKFSKRSYLGKVLSGYSDAEGLRALDKALTDVLQSVGLSLGAAQLRMQAKTFEKLDQLAGLVKMTGAAGCDAGVSGSSAVTADSPVVQAIAQCVGVDVREVTCGTSMCMLVH